MGTALGPELHIGCKNLNRTSRRTDDEKQESLEKRRKVVINFVESCLKSFRPATHYTVFTQFVVIHLGVCKITKTGARWDTIQRRKNSRKKRTNEKLLYHKKTRHI